MNKSEILKFVVIFSSIVLFLNFIIYSSTLSGGATPFSIEWTGILLSLLPLSLVVLVYVFYKGHRSRMLWIALGVITLTMAWEYLADPWSIDLRMRMGQPLAPLLVYNILGLIFLLVAVFVFKQGVE